MVRYWCSFLIKQIIMNLNKHIWEGWTVQSFIDELEPSFILIMSGSSWHKQFETKEEIKEWCISNQPYYKKNIPEVLNYFTKKLKKEKL